MLARLRQRLGLCPAQPHRTTAAPLALPVTEGQKEILLGALQEAASAARPVQLRDLHRITGLPQSVALRALRVLEQEGTASLEATLHDPLGALVELR